MKKLAFLRGLFGFPVGIAIGNIISIICSILWAQGDYVPCVPALVGAMGNEIRAVVLQTVLCGFIGSAFAASSIIWEIENWSIAKQTGVYFLFTAIVMMPIAYFTNWMGHSLTGFLVYFGIFAALFIIMWFAQYLVWKRKIQKLNEKLK